MSLMIDFNRQRAIVRANTHFIEGIALEKIPPGTSGYECGMVLIKRDWKKVYFVQERPNWCDDQYFEHAEAIMIEKGIFKP